MGFVVKLINIIKYTVMLEKSYKLTRSCECVCISGVGTGG